MHATCVDFKPGHVSVRTRNYVCGKMLGTVQRHLQRTLSDMENWSAPSREAIRPLLSPGQSQMLHK